MDIQYIREFISLSEGRDLATVADEYYISQSTLSTHIKKLETELGYALFERTGRRLKLNQKGIQFLEHAKEVIGPFESYLALSRDPPRSKNAGLSVGFSGSTAQIKTAEIIAGFHKDHPSLKMTLFQIFQRKPSEYIVTGKCDFIFSFYHEPTEESISRVPLFEDEFIAILPTNHRLAGKSVITYEDLRGERILLQSDDSRIFLKQLDYFHMFGYEPDICFSVSSELTMMNMIECGAGVGLMIRGSAEKLKTSGIALVGLAPEFRVDFSMLFRTNMKRTEETEAFMRYVLEEYLSFK